jgi:hypothetical protein
MGPIQINVFVPPTVFTPSDAALPLGAHRELLLRNKDSKKWRHFYLYPLNASVSSTVFCNEILVGSFKTKV